ncbi:MAG: hypothetical protein ABSA14_11765 [Acidimicrobiales bacterium]
MPAYLRGQAVRPRALTESTFGLDQALLVNTSPGRLSESCHERFPVGNAAMGLGVSRHIDRRQTFEIPHRVGHLLVASGSARPAPQTTWA